MKLTESEKAACERYSQYDLYGNVNCHRCPMVIMDGGRMITCKAAVEEDEWKRLKEARKEEG